MIERSATSNGQGLTILDRARCLARAGLSVIPVRVDGSKAPLCSWKPYESRRPTDAELRRWFASGDAGLAIIGGAVSGNLECIDFDQGADMIFPAWCELVEAEAPGLMARLSIVRTPGNGYHVWAKTVGIDIPGNTKLALDPSAPRKEQTLIETRGTGGYAIVPGSPFACHSSGKPYQHHSGPELWDVPTIQAKERALLIRCAFLFDRSPQEEVQTGHNGELTAGDDYCARGPDWSEILDGWTVARQSGAVRFWRRPGKDDPGCSATTGAATSRGGRELFCVFSTNASPFPGPSNGRPCSSHSKFSAYTLLRHGGDFKAAAKDLAGQGYGPRHGGAPSANGNPAAVQTCYEVILGILRENYQPVFRRDGMIHSAAQGRDIRPSEMIVGTDYQSLQRLLNATDMPVDSANKPDASKLPSVWRKWAAHALAGLVKELPAEDEAAEVSDKAATDFRRLVTGALNKPLNMARVSRDGEIQECRRLIEWAFLEAKIGNGWEQCRSYLIWSRKEEKTEGGSCCRIAVRVDLFGQIGPPALAQLSHRQFSELARRYEVARAEDDPPRARDEKGKQWRLIELSPAFVSALTAGWKAPV